MVLSQEKAPKGPIFSSCLWGHVFWSQPPNPKKHAPKYKKNDYVKVLATAFDNQNVDKSGRNFSTGWLAEGNGRWCQVTISRVYVKKGRQPQKYGIKFDGGHTMPALEEQIEPANEDGDDEDLEGEEKERDEMYSSDRDSDNESTDYDERNVRSRGSKRRGCHGRG